LDAEPAPDRVPTLSMGAQVEAPQGDVAAVKETRLTVLRNETHFAPVPQPSPLLQISERISAEIETLPASTPAFADAARPHAKTTSESVLKVLHIQLQPAELGTVTVRMSLRDDVLELSLDASEQSTAQQIQKDHEALSTALRSAGYLVEGVTVKVVESDKTQPALQTNFQGAQTSGQSSAQSSSSWSQPDGRSGREQPAAQDRSGDASAWQDVGGDRQGAGGSGGVYV
jgi:chemotaxis protein MotD